MPKFSILSNLNNFEKIINPKIPLQGKIREIIPKIIKTIVIKENEILLLSFKTVGFRIINEMKINEIINLIDGRRHRTYFALKLPNINKIHIKFGWHKIKKLNDIEKNFIAQNWHLSFFENEGRFLVKQSGGTIWPDNLIARYEKTNLKI